MQAIHISQAGNPDVLRLIECEPHALDDGEVLIRVSHAGVNRHDTNQRSAARHPNTRLPANIPGLEACGEVIAVAPGVASPRPGDHVCALVDGGGYAQECVAAAELCIPWPRGKSREGAALPEALFTAWYNLIELAGLSPGQTLLIHGGTSGVGTVAIQLAVARGATVWTTSGTPAKRAMCESLGATRTFGYRAPDFMATLRAAAAASARGGPDAILDLSGMGYFNDNLRLVAEGGRIVYLSSSGPPAAIDTAAMMGRQAWVTASRLRPLPRAAKARLAAGIRNAGWFDLSALRLLIDSEFPLARAADAHRRMETGEHAGKIVLAVPGGTSA